MNRMAAAVIFALATTLAATLTSAQQYPIRPIRILVYSPPGGAPDITTRVVGERLTEVFGQPVVAENRTGSNGNIAGEIVAKAAPDGYTLLLCADSMIVINPHVYSRMPYDPMKDIVPVATLASNVFFLAVNPDQPFKTFQEFIEAAKKANPPLAYASGGNGSQHHLTMEMLKQRAGINLLHVPYKGAAPATTATIAGEVAVEWAGSTAGPQIRAGKLRALAVSGRKRLADFPDVPTVGEFYPGFENTIWLALCAPGGTPEPVIARLRTEVNKILAEPEVAKKFNRFGALEPYITTPEEMNALIRADYDKYGKLVKDVGAKVD